MPGAEIHKSVAYTGEVGKSSVEFSDRREDVKES